MRTKQKSAGHRGKRERERETTSATKAGTAARGATVDTTVSYPGGSPRLPFYFSFSFLSLFYIFNIETPLSMFISPTPTHPAPAFPQFLQLFIISQ